MRSFNEKRDSIYPTDKDIEVGNTVVFSKYGAVEVTLENEEYVILKLEDIYGVIK
ncbi:MAG TPA: hypothetical protein EYG60_00280 [Campylobacterales bacterium]|nr:hypothetical protein [Campylobacterales bacterium]